MKKSKMPHPILIGTAVFWILFILLIYLLTGCKHEPINPCQTYDEISYYKNVRPIIIKNCAVSGCHNNTNGLGNFSIYSELNDRCNSGSFERRVFIKKNMPPSKMDTCDYIILKRWFREGHLNR
jgi:hypothetical protein